MAPIQIRGTGITETPFKPDQLKCHRYGLFMAGLPDQQIIAVFWVLWVATIIMLIFSSHYYTKSEEARQLVYFPTNLQESISTKSLDRLLLQNEAELERKDEDSSHLEDQYITKAWNCTFVTLAILPMMFVSIFVQAISALALQFCHGEDLIMFYYGMWTLIQCGSFIAELGLAVSQLQNCLHPHHPPAPWAVALGTPIPVICGIAHWAKNLIQHGHSENQAEET